MCIGLCIFSKLNCVWNCVFLPQNIRDMCRKFNFYCSFNTKFFKKWKIFQKNEGGIFFLIISLFIAFLLPNFLGPIVYFLHSVYRFGHATWWVLNHSWQHCYSQSHLSRGHASQSASLAPCLLKKQNRSKNKVKFPKVSNPSNFKYHTLKS